jgi:hypothetical protein
MGRPKIRTDREIALEKLWNKLARSTFAMVDYDLYLNKYKPKITKKEKAKLKTACSKAIDAVLKK